MKRLQEEHMAVAHQPISELERDRVLQQLFVLHHRRILRAAYRITGSMADAEDVAQAVFLRLVNSSGDGLKNPSSYLYRAAINGALDLLRRRQTDQMVPLETAHEIASTDRTSAPEVVVSTEELRLWLRSAIGTLSPRAAEVFTLRYLEERSNREIAALMNTSQTVIAVTLHVTRGKLKKQLQAHLRGKS
jgi:RNA polymerase sigma-70 factor, ECF subfamily